MKREKRLKKNKTKKNALITFDKIFIKFILTFQMIFTLKIDIMSIIT